MILQRIRQFTRASAQPSESDFALARSRLAGPLFDLFSAQHPRDIVHSADTARWLIAAGCDDPDTLVAGLLHDVGKGQQRRGDRAAFVLLDAVGLAPTVADAGSRLKVRRALQRTLTHSETSALAMERGGASARAVDLARRHHEAHPADPVLALLQRADAAS